MKHLSSGMIDIGTIHVDPRHNVSRQGQLFKDEADKKNLVGLMFPGWKHEESVGLYVLSPEEVAEAKESRKAFRAGLEESTETLTDVSVYIGTELTKISVVKSEILAGFDKLYKGKTPKLGVVYGNRRCTVMHLVAACRMHANLDVMSEVQASIDEYANAIERARKNIEENERKFEGALAPSLLQKILAARSMVQCGDDQSALRKMFKVGMGQKLWHLLECDRTFSELRIVDRIQEGEIIASQLRWESMRDIVKTGDVELAEQYFKIPKACGNKPKMADRNKWEGLKDRCPVKAIQALAEGALNDNLQDAVKPFVEASAALNVAISTIMGLTTEEKKSLGTQGEALSNAILSIVRK